MGETVNITGDGRGRFGAKPAAFLGASFNAFRDATSTGGATYDAATKSNLTDVDTLPRLVASLEAAGFTVALGTDVRAALVSRAATLASLREGASAATQAMNARLAPRNLALYPFQGEGVAFLRQDPRRGLFDDMGLGKTIQALTAAEMLGTDGLALPVLVICPAVAKGVWARECAKWRPDLTASTCEGYDAFRFPGPGEMVSVNYDILPDMGPPYALPHPGTIVIFDEAQAMKGPKSAKHRRGKAIASLVLAAGGRGWLLTGTPFENDGGETHALLAVIGASDVFGKDGGAPALTRWLAENKPDVFRAAWGRVALRREKRDVLKDLPPKRIHVETVDISPEAAGQLDAILAEMGGAASLDALIASVKGAATDSEASADDKPEFETMARARRVLATAKVPALLERIAECERAGEPLIVMSDHREAIDVLGARKGWGKITGSESARKRTATEEAFQRGELVGVACTIRAAGVALTLTRARLMIFVDRAWNPSKNGQAEDRIWRIGQTRECVIVRLVARHALDERVSEVNDAKEAIRAEAVDAGRTEATSAPVAEAQAAMLALAARPEAPKPVAATVAPAPARPSFVPAGARLFPANRMRARCVVCRAMIETGGGMSWVKDGVWGSAHAPGTPGCVPPLMVTVKGVTREATPSMARAWREGGNGTGGASGPAKPAGEPVRRGPATPREEWAAGALAQLAADDPDRAREQNEIGFNVADGSVGHDLVYLIGTGGLPDAGWRLAVRIAGHYRNTQVGAPPE